MRGIPGSGCGDCRNRMERKSLTGSGMVVVFSAGLRLGCLGGCGGPCGCILPSARRANPVAGPPSGSCRRLGAGKIALTSLGTAYLSTHAGVLWEPAGWGAEGVPEMPLLPCERRGAAHYSPHAPSARCPACWDPPLITLLISAGPNPRRIFQRHRCRGFCCKQHAGIATKP